MAAVFKSMLVAAALLLVGFGADGAAWAKGNRFFFPAQRYDCRGAIDSPKPVASVPRAAFNEHVWVNSTVVQAPMYVDSLNARLTLEEKEAEAAAAARRLILMKESRASAAKRAAAAAQVAASRGGSPRFKFQVTQCGFDLGKRDASRNYPVPVLPPGGWNNPLRVLSPAPVSSPGAGPNSLSQPGLKTSAPASSLDGH